MNNITKRAIMVCTGVVLAGISAGMNAYKQIKQEEKIWVMDEKIQALEMMMDIEKLKNKNNK